MLHLKNKTKKIKSKANMNTSISLFQFTLTNGALQSSIGNVNELSSLSYKFFSASALQHQKEQCLGRYKWWSQMEYIFAMCYTRTAVPPLLDGTLKKHAIIEMEECTIKRLDDVEGTYCSVVFKVTALDHQANQIGEPKRMMRDPLKNATKRIR